METPDYVYQSWLKDAYERISKEKQEEMNAEILEQLIKMNQKMDTLISLQKRSGGTIPSPS